MGVLLVILSSMTGNLEPDFLEVKTQRHFNRAMAMRSLKMGISPRALRAKRYGGVGGGNGSCGWKCLVLQFIRHEDITAPHSVM
jgi:hypothetical protein